MWLCSPKIRPDSVRKLGVDRGASVVPVNFHLTGDEAIIFFKTREPGYYSWFRNVGTWGEKQKKLKRTPSSRGMFRNEMAW